MVTLNRIKNLANKNPFKRTSSNKPSKLHIQNGINNDISLTANLNNNAPQTAKLRKR